MKKNIINCLLVIAFTVAMFICANNQVIEKSFVKSPIAPPLEEKYATYETFAEGNNIPIISVYTKDRAEVLSKEEYVECAIDVFNCEDEYILQEATGGIRVRGNSTSYYGDVEQMRLNKVPYRIKFDEKQSMLGLNDSAECKSWVLLKTEWDLAKNSLAFRMGRAILDGHAFCTDSKYVHLYVNEEFQGVYLLCEQSQVNKYRVNIAEPDDEQTDLNIGYYMEIDNYFFEEPENSYFFVDYANGSATDLNGESRDFVRAEYVVKSDFYADEQVDFIGKYVNNTFDVIYNACTNNIYQTVDANGDLIDSDFSSSYEVANNLLDLESVVNMYILYEIVHDHDVGEGSFYMCIDFSEESNCEKLQFTSPWDFNWAYEYDPVERYYAAAFSDKDFVEEFGDRSNPWFILLMNEDWFVEMVKEKWTVLRSSGALDNCVDTEYEYINTHVYELGKYDEYTIENANYLLDNVRSRFEWLDTQWLLE